MYKTFCIAVLVVGLLALMGHSSSAAPAPFTSPIIVARGKVVNQTGQLSSNTIFTPNQSGLYRLSAYATLTIADPNSTSTTYYSIAWSDGTGPARGATLLATNDTELGSFSNAAIWYELGYLWQDSGISRTFQATAGAPILQYAGPDAADNSAYSLYWTLERLE
jgi:hypothetical protein